MEVYYQWDTLSGEFKGWYANGQIKFSGNYVNGKQDGKWYYWYRNGKISAVQNFVLGEPNDYWYTWFKNGQVQSRFYYLDGNEEGICITFFKNGKKESEVAYHLGMKNGKFLSWYTNGQPEIEAEYKNDKLVKPYKEWYSNGEMTSESAYELEKYNQWVDDFEDFLLSQTDNQEKVRKVRRIVDKKLRHIWEGFEIPYIALPESMELFQVTDIFENINTKTIRIMRARAAMTITFMLISTPFLDLILKKLPYRYTADIVFKASAFFTRSVWRHSFT